MWGIETDLQNPTLKPAMEDAFARKCCQQKEDESPLSAEVAALVQAAKTREESPARTPEAEKNKESTKICQV